MLLEYLNHIRTQPVHARKRFAFMVSIGATGCIVLVWLSVLLAGPSPLPETENTQISTRPETSNDGMFGRLKSALRAATAEYSEETGGTDDETTPATDTADARFRSVFSATSTPPIDKTPDVLATTTTPAPVAASSSPTSTPDGFLDSVINEVGQ